MDELMRSYTYVHIDTYMCNIGIHTHTNILN